MSDLVAFLLARIEEDERFARATVPGPWVSRVEGRDMFGGDNFIGTAPTSGGAQTDLYLRLDTTGDAADRLPFDVSDATQDHIVRHNPARVLAECAAKRAIIEHHAPIECMNAHHPDGLHCAVCEYDEIPRGWHPCPTLRMLARPHVDHPDFDPAWKVET